MADAVAGDAIEWVTPVVVATVMVVIVVAGWLWR
jgi:hypothetical protein